MAVQVISMTLAAVAVATASLILNSIAVRTACQLGFVANPDEVNRHGRTVPLLGGPAIFLAASPAIVVAAWVLPTWKGFIPALSVALLIGILKDRGREISPLLQLGCQAAAGLMLYAGGLALATGVGEAVDCFATIILCIMLINGVNFLDVQDGLAAGSSLVALVSLAAMALLADSDLVAALAILVASAVGGFLVHNWPPAKLFMGDAGSFALGLMLAALALALMPSLGQGAWTALLPLSLPIVELLVTVQARIASGRPVFVGDGRHASTMLVTAWGPSAVLAAAGLFVCAAGAVGAALVINGYAR